MLHKTNVAIAVFRIRLHNTIFLAYQFFGRIPSGRHPTGSLSLGAAHCWLRQHHPVGLRGRMASVLYTQYPLPQSLSIQKYLIV
jgi:hypothetical protein